MKLKKFISSILVCGIISVGFVACSDDDDGDDPKPTGNNNGNNGGGNTGPTIMEKIKDNDDLDSMEVALVKVGLDSALESSEKYTVFALTNASFIKILNDFSAQSIKTLPEKQLKDILSYHISNEGKFKTADLSGSTYLQSLNNNGSKNTKLSIQVVAMGGNYTINGTAKVIEGDKIEASNGIVHVLDMPYEEANILDFIKSDPRLDSFNILINDNRIPLSNQFKNGTKTLFAPTNQGFANYVSSDGSIDQISDIRVTSLPAIVSHHYINRKNIHSDDFKEGQELETQQGSNLIVHLNNGIKLETINAGQADVNVSVTDIQTTSGIIHLVDEVLKF